MAESSVARKTLSLLTLSVSFVAAHSIVLGIILIAAPTWLLAIFGWSIECHKFFLQQAGVFHILLGSFYAIEFFAYHHIRMLLTAKVSAVLFLTAHCIWSVPQPGVLLSNCADAGMAIIAVVLWLRSNHSRTARQFGR